MTIGGKDVIYVKQHRSSPLSTMEIKTYVQDVGNQRFSDKDSLTSSGQLKLKDKASSQIFLCIRSSFHIILRLLNPQGLTICNF